MCRHTVGLNWTAIAIEHVGYSDAQVLNNRAQFSASVRLVRWLRCRFHIQIKNVIGHNESLSSPYHREDVPALRSQTHGDFNHADMRVYRVSTAGRPLRLTERIEPVRRLERGGRAGKRKHSMRVTEDRRPGERTWW
jgi:hypothetical protein